MNPLKQFKQVVSDLRNKIRNRFAKTMGIKTIGEYKAEINRMLEDLEIISDYDISHGWEFYSIYKVGQTLRVTKATNVLGYYTAECLTFTPPLTVILTNVDPFVLYGICYYNGELGKVILFTKEKKDKFEIINTHPSFEDAVSSKEWLKSKTNKNPQELEIKDEEH